MDIALRYYGMVKFTCKLQCFPDNLCNFVIKLFLREKDENNADDDMNFKIVVILQILQITKVLI